MESAKLKQVKSYVRKSKILIVYQEIIEALIDMAYTAGEYDQLERDEKRLKKL